MARQTKDAATRAREALDVAERRVKSLEERQSTWEKNLEVVKGDLERAKERRDYLAQNPDLPKNDPKPTGLIAPNGESVDAVTDPEF